MTSRATQEIFLFYVAKFRECYQLFFFNFIPVNVFRSNTPAKRKTTAECNLKRNIPWDTNALNLFEDKKEPKESRSRKKIFTIISKFKK